MKITSVLVLSAALFGFSNCTTDTPAENAIEKEQSQEEMQDAGTAHSVNATTAAAVPDATEPVDAPDQVIAPVQFNTNEASTTPVKATPVTGNTAAPKPNPPHGQPGHVCGQPVTGANPTAAQMPSTQPGLNPVQMNAPQPVTLPTGGATAGLNPAHGQPGHVCGVAVGAPLPKN